VTAAPTGTRQKLRSQNRTAMQPPKPAPRGIRLFLFRVSVLCLCLCFFFVFGEAKSAYLYLELYNLGTLSGYGRKKVPTRNVQCSRTAPPRVACMR